MAGIFKDFFFEAVIILLQLSQLKTLEARKKSVQAKLEGRVPLIDKGIFPY